MDRKNEVAVITSRPNFWKYFSVLLFVALIVVLLVKVDSSDKAAPTTKAVADDVKVGDYSENPVLGSDDAKLVLVEYGDFQCPFCGKFFKDTFPDLKKNYIDTGKVKLVFLNMPLPFHKFAEDAAKAGECAFEQGKFWDFHDTVYADQSKLDGDYLKTIAKDLGLDVEKFNNCMGSEEVAKKVQSDLDLADGDGVEGTPGFVLLSESGKKFKFSGAYPYDYFENILDSAISGELWDRKPVKLTVVTSKDCKECDTSKLISASKQMFEGLDVDTVYMEDEDGKKLVEQYKLERLPVYLFSAEIEKSTPWMTNPKFKMLFEKAGDMYRLNDDVAQPVKFVDPEKQAEYEKELEKEKEEMKKALGIEDGAKPQIDFFVMSFCPFGNQAEELVEKVYESLKDKASFKPRYVIYSNYQGGSKDYCMGDESQYCSMHGIQEVHQDIRELCVYNQYGIDKYFKFILGINKECNAHDVDKCWEDVAKDAGLDVAKIQDCQDEQGEELLDNELKLNKMLDVSGSPTIFINGELYSGERSVKGYQDALCEGFGDNKPEECANIQDVAVAAPTGGCGN